MAVNKVLTAEEISELVASMQKHPYLAMVGDTVLGPLASPPGIAKDVATQDVTLYETGDEAQASYVTRNNVILTLETRKLDEAVALINAVPKGANAFAANLKKVITLTPLTSDATAKAFVFPNAYLQPGLEGSLGENSTPSTITLPFTCKADPATGLPFTFAAS